MGKKKSTRKKIAFSCALPILVLLIIYGGLRIAESTFFFRGQGTSDGTPSKTITVDGVDYFPRQDISVYLIVGLDTEEKLVSSEFFRNDRDADVVMLLIMDHNQKKYDILTLNRDTMVSMPRLGISGGTAGTVTQQLTLAYTYGSGMADSCENISNVVSGFLLDANIDHYLTMSMSAIAILNDGIGGVTVNVTDDFSQVDPTITMGQVTLKGEQAIHFLRARQNVGNQLNVSRMERHKEYMNGFMNAYLNSEKDTASDVLALYNALMPYTLTDCSDKDLSLLLRNLKSYEFGQYYTPQGENVRGDRYYEFYADEADVTRLSLELFYTRKE